MKRLPLFPGEKLHASSRQEAAEKRRAEQGCQTLDAALTAYIQAESGGPNDLDEELEAAGVDHLLGLR